MMKYAHKISGGKVEKKRRHFYGEENYIVGALWMQVIQVIAL
jgi:hypothetical protein